MFSDPDIPSVEYFDAHLHIIDPRFPLVANDGFVPEAFTCDDYMKRMRDHRLACRSIQLNDEFGWLPTPGLVFSVEKADAAGHRYRVDFRTDEHGFRMYGDIKASAKKKVLFIGDSYTHAVDVSNEKTYYGLLSKMADIEVIAVGGGGYGTLHEYMQLDRHIDEISPDIVVIQYCYNDFINNSDELEAESTRNNNGIRRPYLTGDGLAYRNPGRLPVIRDFANNHSRFIYFVLKRLDRLHARGETSVEEVIAQDGIEYPAFR